MISPNVQQVFEAGLAWHQAGRLAEAEQCYRQVLAAQPEHPDALHLLGVVALQVGQIEPAIQLIQQAIALAPRAAMYHCNLSSAFKDLGRFPEAIAAAQAALAIDPVYPEGLNNLGVAFEGLGDLVAAERVFREALRLRPDYVEAMNNLGNALRNTGRARESLDFYQRALHLRPEYADARINLGVALADERRHDEAVAEYQHALQLKPQSAEGHFNFANALRDLGRWNEALAEYRRAVELQPRLARARNNLANLMKDCGMVAEALGEYRLALQTGADLRAHSNLLLSLHYLEGGDPAQIFAEHRAWDERHAAPLGPRPERHPNDRSPERRLRVGFVSPDFREHSVAYFFENVLAAIDRTQIEAFCYSDVAAEDAATARLRRLADHWRPANRLSAQELGAQIRADAIDILVDLAGHTGDHRLEVFAQKPAPVQVSWLGYCNTTGMRAIDYRLTDALVDPPGEADRLNSERLVRLPHCGWCFRAPEQAPEPGLPPALAAGHVTFGSFNALPKITDQRLALWARILAAVPHSRLLLKNLGLRVDEAHARCRARLLAAGIPADRFELLGNTWTVAQHLPLYSRVDIALDTFPYHGVTTTCEALWMGVPVVVQEGNSHVSRVGVSLLRNVGLGEFIARDAEDYVRLATTLAGDLPRLSALRASMRERLSGSPLMDAARAARDVTAAFREMWRTWCARPAAGS